MSHKISRTFVSSLIIRGTLNICLLCPMAIPPIVTRLLSVRGKNPWSKLKDAHYAIRSRSDDRDDELRTPSVIFGGAIIILMEDGGCNFASSTLLRKQTYASVRELQDATVKKLCVQ